MAFSISRDQQKTFIENFMGQTLDLALELTEKGEDRDSPGETIYAIAKSIIAQLMILHPEETTDD